MRLDASTAEIIQFLQSQGYQVHFPVEAEIGDGQARVSVGTRHVIVTRNASGLHAEYENTTPPDTVAYDLQAVLHALRRHITSGDVAVFDDVAIPTVGDDSFLLALPSRGDLPNRGSTPSRSRQSAPELLPLRSIHRKGDDPLPELHRQGRKQKA